MNRPGISGLVFGMALFWLVTAAAGAAEQKKKGAPAAGQVRIQQVEVRLTEVGPVVLLIVENKAIPVFVDATVAESIHAAQTGGKLRRPFTHDLMHSVLAAFGGKVTQVVITLKGGTYYAELTVILGDLTKVFDSRASDAIALAIHFKAPMTVSRELLESAGKELEAPPGGLSL